MKTCVWTVKNLMDKLKELPEDAHVYKIIDKDEIMGYTRITEVIIMDNNIFFN